ncbi:hypothetical protein KIPB_008683 [Kipferlia bialata]|uniref:Uncharacterized protein n=1 Tax=Kipferlia bialata TaxID=797122 RepID=A0A9K3D2Q4_9EUKA|nr:hypothetical protein KIPB_008683 [Kipferlia bialata]|eukprot:g8683.t1
MLAPFTFLFVENSCPASERQAGHSIPTQYCCAVLGMSTARHATLHDLLDAGSIKMRGQAGFELDTELRRRTLQMKGRVGPANSFTCTPTKGYLVKEPVGYVYAIMRPLEGAPFSLTLILAVENGTVRVSVSPLYSATHGKTVAAGAGIHIGFNPQGWCTLVLDLQAILRAYQPPRQRPYVLTGIKEVTGGASLSLRGVWASNAKYSPYTLPRPMLLPRAHGTPADPALADVPPSIAYHSWYEWEGKGIVQRAPSFFQEEAVTSTLRQRQSRKVGREAQARAKARVQASKKATPSQSSASLVTEPAMTLDRPLGFTLPGCCVSVGESVVYAAGCILVACVPGKESCCLPLPSGAEVTALVAGQLGCCIYVATDLGLHVVYLSDDTNLSLRLGPSVPASTLGMKTGGLTSLAVSSDDSRVVVVGLTPRGLQGVAALDTTGIHLRSGSGCGCPSTPTPASDATTPLRVVAVTEFLPVSSCGPAPSTSTGVPGSALDVTEYATDVMFTPRSPSQFVVLTPSSIRVCRLVGAQERGQTGSIRSARVTIPLASLLSLLPETVTAPETVSLTCMDFMHRSAAVQDSPGLLIGTSAGLVLLLRLGVGADIAKVEVAWFPFDALVSISTISVAPGPVSETVLVGSATGLVQVYDGALESLSLKGAYEGAIQAYPRGQGTPGYLISTNSELALFSYPSGVFTTVAVGLDTTSPGTGVSLCADSRHGEVALAAGSCLSVLSLEGKRTMTCQFSQVQPGDVSPPPSIVDMAYIPNRYSLCVALSDGRVCIVDAGDASLVHEVSIPQVLNGKGLRPVSVCCAGEDYVCVALSCGSVLCLAAHLSYKPLRLWTLSLCTSLPLLGTKVGVNTVRLVGSRSDRQGWVVLDVCSGQSIPPAIVLVGQDAHTSALETETASDAAPGTAMCGTTPTAEVTMGSFGLCSYALDPLGGSVFALIGRAYTCHETRVSPVRHRIGLHVERYDLDTGSRTGGVLVQTVDVSSPPSSAAEVSECVRARLGTHGQVEVEGRHHTVYAVCGTSVHSVPLPLLLPACLGSRHASVSVLSRTTPIPSCCLASCLCLDTLVTVPVSRSAGGERRSVIGRHTVSHTVYSTAGKEERLGELIRQYLMVKAKTGTALQSPEAQGSVVAPCLSDTPTVQSGHTATDDTIDTIGHLADTFKERLIEISPSALDGEARDTGPQ